MNIHHNTLVLVADGKKFLLLRNTGDFKAPVLVCEESGEQENPSARDQGSSPPGRAFGSGAARSAVEQADFHRQAKQVFAGFIAERLGKLEQGGDFEELVVVAPARTLAELRAHCDQQVSARIVAEIDKDLTRHPVDEIAAILLKAD
ncbi:MAG: host attachment protein [Sphingomonadales bacterium]|nr:host attachment protein [Sphingomonadales bacterium]MDE2568701.1 host attachment protein [Sphingomonadales bacterium]